MLDMEKRQKKDSLCLHRNYAEIVVAYKTIKKYNCIFLIVLSTTKRRVRRWNDGNEGLVRQDNCPGTKNKVRRNS